MLLYVFGARRQGALIVPTPTGHSASTGPAGGDGNALQHRLANEIFSQKIG
jgi:hypothetical protein